jgi:hypothetical protein
MQEESDYQRSVRVRRLPSCDSSATITLWHISMPGAGAVHQITNGKSQLEQFRSGLVPLAAVAAVPARRQVGPGITALPSACNGAGESSR